MQEVLIVLESTARSLEYYRTFLFPTCFVCAIFRVMAIELGPHNIRVNTVGPTVVMTEMAIVGGWKEPQKSQEMINKIPLGRFAGT